MDYSLYGEPVSALGNEPAIYDRFMELNPNIELEFSKGAFKESFHPKIDWDNIKLDNSADVIYYYHGLKCRKLANEGNFADLTPYLTKEFRKNYLPITFSPAGPNGGVYSLPYTLSASHVLYSNTRLLKKLKLKMPRDFEEFTRMAPIIKTAGYEPIIMANNSCDWIIQTALFSTIMGRLGGTGWAKKVVRGELSFEDRAFIDSLQLIKEFYNSGLLSTTTFKLDYSVSPTLFADGKAPFMLDGDWRTRKLIEIMNEKEQKNIEMTVIPTIPGELEPAFSTSVVLGTGLAMRSGLSPEKAYAAWKLISYYAGEQEGMLRLEQEGVIPTVKLSTRKMDLPPLLKERIDFYQKIEKSLPILDNIFPGPVTFKLHKGLYDVAGGKTTPEELAADLDETLNDYKKSDSLFYLYLLD